MRQSQAMLYLKTTWSEFQKFCQTAAVRGNAELSIYILKKTLPPQSRSQAVVYFSTPRMYPRSGYFLVLNIDFTKPCHENNRETVKPSVSDFVETVKKLKPASTLIISPLNTYLQVLFWGLYFARRVSGSKMANDFLSWTMFQCFF